MEVTENALEPMEDSSTSSSGEEEESGGQEDMEGSDQEEEEEKAANPAFSKFMQGFWDLASVDVPVRCVACPNTTPPSLNQVFFWIDGPAATLPQVSYAGVFIIQIATPCVCPLVCFERRQGAPQSKRPYSPSPCHHMRTPSLVSGARRYPPSTPGSKTSQQSRGNSPAKRVPHTRAVFVSLFLGNRPSPTNQTALLLQQLALLRVRAVQAEPF